MKVMKSSRKADYAAKHAPPFCEIWFVDKGKHVWTREASNCLPPMLDPSEITLTDAFNNHKSDLINNPPFRNGKLFGEESDQWKVALSVARNSFLHRSLQRSSSPKDITAPSGSNSEMVVAKYDSEVEEKRFHDYIIEARKETEISKNEAFAELLKRKGLESDAVETINKVKDYEAAHAREVQLRKEVENALKTTKWELKKILKQREELLMGITQASLETFQNKKQKIRRHKEEATRCLEWWKSHRQVGTLYYSDFLLVNATAEFTRFSVSDLHTVTCNFSESFKIGQGGCGCVFKGEIRDRSVAIKKLHPLNMQGISEFHEEVQILSKLQHPHLVAVIGACPEAWSLVYEFLPNGSIQDHLSPKANKCPLTWKIRTRIVAEISSALLYLHSYKPVEIVHGDLKPENILLDLEFHCKIGDFGICRLMSEETSRCPSFRGSIDMISAFPYTDPELQRTGKLITKSDVYAFGIIILQLLTGRPPVGLASDIRQAVMCGKLASVLDLSAGDWPASVAKRLVEMGLQFCQVNSKDRSELKPTVVRDLKRLQLTEERTVPSFFLCPILQEIMYDPHVAADGFTYEGEALREWFKKGRETSPITNLKLSHLHLTPNRALQIAIQDWLCQS
ncbi:hypothetical protein GIB67_011799 [Kingdonia uniflora]|uniref:RING-type E3 ubiquitin transferase n=1 Tax=Kingdonia uniflora TaxID=39325 RepID=A0A7J7NY43_9MAGN|nr:hypothetical protein GIB67_011799 [Kingdonia uniflora]